MRKKEQTTSIRGSLVLVGLGVHQDPEGDNLEPTDLAGSQTNFGMGQTQDPTMQQVGADVQVIDGTPINDRTMPNSFSHFIMRKGLGYRVSKIRVDVVEQLLVPT